MDHEITASFVWTAEELIKAQENHWRVQCRPSFRIILVLFSMLMIIAGVGGYLKDGLSASSIFLTLGGLYFVFIRKYEARWMARRRFKKRPDKDAQVVVVLQDENLHTKTADSESKQNWNQISKVRKARNGFLLYPNDSLYCFLPSSAFRSEIDRLSAENLFRSKVKDFAEVR
jgi:hypothetical protein